ncbi:MAG: amidase [Myxococcales bacterium]
MISYEEYAALDAVAMAALVAAGKVSASELLEAAIARAELVNPRLNAIVIPMHAIARERAAGPLAGSFAGVPFLLKDLYQDYAGVLSTSGCGAYRRAGYVPRRHSVLVERWLAAGLVMFGRTNTPEFGGKGITEPHAWGATRNPWQLSRTPGGSSGGAAAAVAAGVVPMAGASDGGGSIRIPAAYTGLFGFKPGRGRTPTGPEMGEALHGAAMNHVLTRTVRDSATMLDATHGPESGSITRLAAPARPYAEEVQREPGRMRIAFSTRSPLGTDVHADAVRAIERTAHTLEGLGHHVEEAEPELDGRALARDFCSIWFAQLALQVQLARTSLRAINEDFELDTLAIEAIGKARSAVSYAESYVNWTHYSFQLSEFLRSYDVYMTPTQALPPARVGEQTTPRWAEQLMRVGSPLGLLRLVPLAAKTIEETTLNNLAAVPFTQLANVTGVPAMSLPLAQFADGLPLGVQFMAEHGEEGRLFGLAGQLERALPWHTRRPAVV